MTDKKIFELPLATSVDQNSLFVVDQVGQTHKVELETIAVFVRDWINPAGCVQQFAGSESAVPAGWLICGGQAVSRSTYSRLFAAIGTTYGIGDGSTTFNVPDCRGRGIAGKDDMGGSAASRITNAIAGIDGTALGAVGGGQSYTPAGQIGGSQSIAHTHGVTVANHAHTINHNHLVSFVDNTSSRAMYFQTANNRAVTTWTGATGTVETVGGRSSGSSLGGGGGTDMWNPFTQTTGGRYTGGIVNSIGGGAGETAVSGNGGAQSVVSTGMLTGGTVNGSNFTFTGTAAHRVQPTIVLNMIIKT